MRLTFLPFAIVLALAAGPQPGREGAGLLEFLNWAHPDGNGCGRPTDIVLLERWDGGLRASYRIVCGAVNRDLEGVFQVREGAEVWQVSAGFEVAAARLESALAAARGPVTRPRGPAVPPPPGNPGTRVSDTPLGLVPPPEAIEEIPAEYPEEAGRARTIGEAHVELLVQITPAGSPLRTRSLRGPDPDLGMRRAATEAVMRWSFRPARLGSEPVTFFLPVELSFKGLPPETRDWVHRALFDLQAIVSDDPDVVDEALRRAVAGEPFETLVADAGRAGAVYAGDWGVVAAATLPAAVRKALHEARVGGLAGPVSAEGLHYLLKKRGEVYYAIRQGPEGDLSYQVLHQRNPPGEEALRQAIESDIADYLSERRRDDFINAAAVLMGIRHHRTEIGQLEIHTDILDDDEVKTLGQVVQGAIRAHEEFWSPLLALRPFNQRILVYAWARQADHDRLHRVWQAGRKKPPAPAAADDAGTSHVATGLPAARPESWSFAGEYVPSSRILSVPCEKMRGHLPVPIIVHEAIHMLDYERTYAAGAEPSQWFEEGLATYFGFSQIGGRLNIEAGDIQRSRTIITGNVRLQFDPRSPLLDYLRKIKDEGPVPLGALLTSKSGDPLWSGAQAVRAYGASWTLVHFLLHGAKGAHREAFGDYARAEAQGKAGYETFLRLFGPDLKGLETAWHRYEEDL